jgi:hypothetical protein
MGLRRRNVNGENELFSNNKRILWIVSNRYFFYTPPNLTAKNLFPQIDYHKGISYIDLNDEFIQENIKIDTNLMFIKSDLDKYYESLPETKGTKLKFNSILGFKDNDIIVMLYDKWVNTEEKITSPNNIHFYNLLNYKWYESTIYIYDFNNLKSNGNNWDTLNLSEGFSLLIAPQLWVVENRFAFHNNDFIDSNEAYYFYSSCNTYLTAHNLGIYKWSDNELAVALLPKGIIKITADFENANRIFLIYNFDTKKWRKFEFPKELNLPLLSNKSIIDWNGSKYFYISPASFDDTTYTNKLIKYDPNASIK